MSYTLTIPKPCSEDWNKMSPTQKGAFCKSCSKEVIDFSNTSKMELSRKIKKGENICGRFKPSQLNTPLPSVHKNQWKRNAAILGFTSVLSVATPMAAQEKEPTPTHQTETIVMGRVAHQPVIKDSITLRGNVKDHAAIVPGANVYLKGTNYITKTDLNGNFQLTLPNNALLVAETLVISYLGYENIEMKVTAQTKFIKAKFLEQELRIMGEISVLPPPSILKKAGNLLRKK